MWELTGRTRRIRGWLLNKQRLEVQVRKPHWSDNPGLFVYKWRPAKMEDVLALDLDVRASLHQQLYASLERNHPKLFEESNSLYQNPVGG